MTRRLVSILLAVAFICVLFPSTALAAVSGDYEYTNNGDGTCTITKYTGSAVAISIPSSLGGLSVKSIGYGAFISKELTSVSIPSSVTTIGDDSFAWNHLTHITIPNSVTTIGEYAFAENAITSATIGNSVKTIREGAFAWNSLTSVSIPSSVLYIGDWTFVCNNLNQITIPKNVLTIGEGAFCENSLTYFKLPSGLDKWEDGHGKSYYDGATVKDLKTSYYSARYYIQIEADASYQNKSFNKHKITVQNRFDTDITTRITNAAGATVVNIEYYKTYSGGSHNVYWNGNDKDGKPVASGTYYIVAICRMNDGSIKYSKKKLTYTDNRKPTITSNSIYNKTSDNTHKITVGVKFDCDLTVRIANAGGKTVKNIKYYQPYSEGTHSVYWDGEDSAGNPVPEGTYTIVAIERKNGNIWYTKRSLKYITDEMPALASNSKYTKTGANRHLIKFTISEDSKVTVAIKDAYKKTVRNIEYKEDFEAGQHNVYWDGKDNKGNVVKPGTYYIYVIRYDDDGKYYYKRKKLTFTIFAYPTIYSNSYYTRTGSNRHLIKVDIATDAKVSTCIKDSSFKTVLYLEYKVQYEDGRFYVYWDGKDKHGNDVPNGTYYIYAIKYNDDGTYKWRRKKLTLNG